MTATTATSTPASAPASTTASTTAPARLIDRETYSSLTGVKRANADIGGAWFAPGNMRYFGTRAYEPVRNGQFFVTRENGGIGRSPRFTIRACVNGDIVTVSALCQFATKSQALHAAGAYVAIWLEETTATHVLLRADGTLELRSYGELAEWLPGATTGDQVLDMIAEAVWPTASASLPAA